MRQLFLMSLMIFTIEVQASIPDGLIENKQGALTGAIAELLLSGSSPDDLEVRELQSQLDNLTEDQLVTGAFEEASKPKLLKMSQAHNP